MEGLLQILLIISDEPFTWFGLIMFPGSVTLLVAIRIVGLPLDGVSFDQHSHPYTHHHSTTAFVQKITIKRTKTCHLHQYHRK